MRGLYGRGLLGVLSVFISISSADAAPTLTIYSARHYDTDTQLFAQFEAQTGATIRVLTAGDDELIERLRAEGVRTPADVLLTVDAGRLWRAAQAGLYQPVDSPTLNQRIPPHLRDTEGQWFGFSVRARVIAYPLAKGVPEGISRYDDLVSPAAKGKVCVRSSSNIYNQSLLAALIAHDGVEAATAWAQGLVANMARPPQGNDTAQLEAVARGECDLALVNSYYLLRLQDEGKMLALGMLFPNQADRGTHINISGGGVIKHSQNKELAVRFLEFLTSPEAQAHLANTNHEFPVVADTPVKPLIAQYQDFKADTLPMAALGELNAQAVRASDSAGWK